MKALSLLAALATAVPCAAAADPAVALKGHDPVAYFTLGKPVLGTPAHTHEWDGSRYRFANEAHLALFRADPERYAPRFSGHCTISLGDGRRVEADPAAWAIVDGKLYLALTPRGAGRLEREPELIERAQAAWQRQR